jgi:uncharacterized damage-inducible protein DinB
MSSSAIAIESYCFTHQRILKHLRKLTDDQFYTRVNPKANPIAWHAWHLARWADYFQACIPAMTPELSHRLPPGVQIWQAENLRDAWGFPAELGYAETGMEMPDDVALTLTFPAKNIILDYLSRAFALADKAVQAIDDEQFQAAEQPQPLTEGIFGENTVGHALIVHIMHENRHLGMMECLLGLQGVPGTATV